MRWRVVVDTTAPELVSAEKQYARGNLVTLQGRSLILLQQSLPTAKQAGATATP